MDLKWILVMVAGFIAAMVGMNKQKAGASWGQILAIIGAIIAVAGAAMNLMGFFRQGSQSRDRENRYMYLQARMLADELKKETSAQKVAVICDSSLFLDEWGDPLAKTRESPWMDAVKDAFKGAEVIPVYKKFKIKKPANDQAGMMMPPPMAFGMMSGADFKKIADEIKKIKPDVIVNIHTFPQDGKLPAALQMLKGYKIGFLNCCSNDELRFAFKDGGKNMAEVIAVVMTKSDAAYDDTIPSNDKKAFDRRFVLVTKSDYESGMKKANGGR
ncbi:MAG: hypothetical protein ACI4SG_00120 [Oligosphaeraceae bacterium]